LGPYRLPLEWPEDLAEADRPPRDDAPEREDDLEDFLAEDFLADDFLVADFFAGAFFAAFFAAVRPPRDVLPERVEVLLEDFLAAVRPLELRLDDDLPDDFFALDFVLAIRDFSLLSLVDACAYTIQVRVRNNILGCAHIGGTGRLHAASSEHRTTMVTIDPSHAPSFLACERAHGRISFSVPLR
jgi:hypothetical protein